MYHLRSLRRGAVRRGAVYKPGHQRANDGHAVGAPLARALRTRFFPVPAASDTLRVCVPVTAFPVLGGTRTVLAGVAQVTEGSWQVEYLTRAGAPRADQFVIHRFGTPRMFPSQFPNVWLYCIAGFWKLLSLLRKGKGYHLLLPQDGVFTSAFTGIAGKLAGVRVVCIDHGNLTLVKNRAYRIERIHALHTKQWSRIHQVLARLRYACYWPSLRLLTAISARCVDHFLIPGIEGDGVEEQCRQLGIPQSRITRFASVISMERHVVPESGERARIRAEKGIGADAIVMSLVCRLAPEKGLDIALAGIRQALADVSEAVRARVCVIIAGDGPLRQQIEEKIRDGGLSQNCVLWGEISPADVLTLLGVSDIFLYTSTRGACFSMSVLEAMASGCAVIASTAPLSNAHLLAEGRGIAVPPGDAQQTGRALVRLVNDLELCSQMGRLAREYIAHTHSAALFKQTLTRVGEASHRPYGDAEQGGLGNSQTSHIRRGDGLPRPGGQSMNRLTRRQKLWRTFPVIGLVVWEWEVWRKYQAQPCYRLMAKLSENSELLPYPIDMWPLLAMPGQRVDDAGVLYTLATDAFPSAYHPTDIAQYALVHWNRFLATGDDKHCDTFLVQARWLVAHETRIADDVGGWPIPFPHPDYGAFKPWLSALTQGVGISTLMRAYQLTGEEVFLEVARRALRTFELDILDGGVRCVVGDDGVFFEEVAVYPATHILNGYILSLFGLYDYVALTHDTQIRALIEHSLATLHTLIDDFDLGYGSRYDLSSRNPTNRFYHALHVTLFAALADYSGCEHCAALSAQWAGYQRGFTSFINYCMWRSVRYRRALKRVFNQKHPITVASEQTGEKKIAHDSI